MIETIYSNDNGDADKTSKAQTNFKMPKNIRQVGKSNAVKKIYVEDYVMSFIKQLAGGEYSDCSIAVLVGQCVKTDNCRNIFISGVVKINDADAVNEIAFTNDTWTAIYEDIKKYFVETEIVGWFIGGPGYLLAEEEKIQKTHVDNFAGQDKVLLTYDNLEKEENFYCYENNRLSKQEGYYIYYEKNDEMQTYIIDHKQGGSCEEDYEDKVSKNIRTVIESKKDTDEENKGVTKLMYAAGTLLAVIVLIIGAAMLRNYDQMQSMQDTLNHLSKNMQKVQDGLTGDETSDNTTKDTNGQTQNEQGKVVPTASVTKAADKDASLDDNSQDSLDVEVEHGNVEPLNKDDDKSAQTSKSNVTSKDSNNKDTASDKELATKKDSSKKTPTPKPKTSTKSNTKSSTTKAATTYYTVKSGDTLATISYKLYNTYTQVKKIMQLNGIEDQDLIYEGQKLIVPKK